MGKTQDVARREASLGFVDMCIWSLGEFLWVRACFFTLSLGEDLLVSSHAGKTKMLHVERG